MSTSYDAIVIGAGQAGPPLAVRFAAKGMTVALIERKFFGGTCVNTGCTPTKTLVASAYAAHLARRSAEYGVNLGGPVTVDMKRVKRASEDGLAESRARGRGWVASMDVHGLPRPCAFRIGDHGARRRRGSPSRAAFSSMSAAAL